ncbi:MAG: hypothetical protein ABJC66_04210 [Gammaproteobacteria bacterium]
MNARRRALITAPRFMPLWGVFIGAVGAAVYWIGAQFWPTSVAVILSMLAANLTAARMDAAAAAEHAAQIPAREISVPVRELLGMVFAILVKYNTLMALSAASLPFAMPANLALGVIMIAGYAASRALLVSLLAAPAYSKESSRSAPVSHADLAIALAIGFAPAVLIGIPGLIGLVAAIAARFVAVAYLRRSRPSDAGKELDMTRQVTEVCFYLGALAAWAYG